MGELSRQSSREELATMRNLAVDLARVLNQLVDHRHGVAPMPDTGAVLARARKAGLLNARLPEASRG
jgi:hypothetical protein